jgi:cell fate (sporulation/competence/biofilm development) regulator YmcA (YheA/YmcA/DUF963 family)
MIFLIEYDRSRGVLSSISTFDDAERAAAENERLKRELELHRTHQQREIVLLQAESEAALQETHRRYFADVATLATGLN